ncbi:MAG: glycosyltransferase family 2 protein [Candidatus Omnitrophica bacterium]|nr:glycosyltransferase family 2 protein [Candidatus Omnitrophota bacterium]
MSVKLSVIIVEYRCLEEVSKCLESVSRYLRGISYETVVSVNSFYEKNAISALEKEYPSVKWLINRKNLGFAGGVNAGIRNSSGEYILLLNPDVQFMDNSLQEALRYMDDNKAIGILGPKILDPLGNAQDSSRSFMTPGILVKRAMKRVLSGSGGPVIEDTDHDRPHETDWVSGGCMIIDRGKLGEVGLFDERYFLYVEDMDIARRFWDEGYKVVYWPFMTVTHRARRASAPGTKNLFFIKYSVIHMVSYFRYLIKFKGEAGRLRKR